MYPLTSSAVQRLGRRSSQDRPLWPRETAAPPRGLCLPYLGQMCATLLYNRTVYVQPADTLAVVEERVREALSVIQASPDLSQVSHS